MSGKPDEAPSEKPLQPWEQQPGEPDRWYGKFEVYLALGPTRTFIETVRQERSSKGIGPARLGDNWRAQIVRWRWRERAHAWDAYQRNLLAVSERNVRLSLRNRRIGVMEDALETIRTALDRANIADADQELAREWLPQLRVFLRDMLVAERQEFEQSRYDKDDPDNQLAITADDLQAAQRALEASKTAAVMAPVVVPPPHYKPQCPFLVCVGADAGLELDLAALRAVRVATGLKFQRLIRPTRQTFGDTLRRQRGLGHPIEFLHMALHASADGIEFVNGVADGIWLSERLAGVRVLLLASCSSASVGDVLGVVPYVITLNEEISHEDAAALTQHFWYNIGRGQEPDVALDGALCFCPPAVGEYVVRHW